MGCPTCASKNLNEGYNVDESICHDCGCVFRSSNGTIFIEGTFDKVCESTSNFILERIQNPSLRTELTTIIERYSNEGFEASQDLIRELNFIAEGMSLTNGKEASVVKASLKKVQRIAEACGGIVGGVMPMTPTVTTVTVNPLSQDEIPQGPEVGDEPESNWSPEEQLANMPYGEQVLEENTEATVDYFVTDRYGNEIDVTFTYDGEEAIVIKSEDPQYIGQDLIDSGLIDHDIAAELVDNSIEDKQSDEFDSLHPEGLHYEQSMGYSGAGQENPPLGNYEELTAGTPYEDPYQYQDQENDIRNAIDQDMDKMATPVTPEIADPSVEGPEGIEIPEPIAQRDPVGDPPVDEINPNPIDTTDYSEPEEDEIMRESRYDSVNQTVVSGDRIFLESERGTVYTVDRVRGKFVDLVSDEGDKMTVDASSTMLHEAEELDVAWEKKEASLDNLRAIYESMDLDDEDSDETSMKDTDENPANEYPDMVSEEETPEDFDDLEEGEAYDANGDSDMSIEGPDGISSEDGMMEGEDYTHEGDEGSECCDDDKIGADEDVNNVMNEEKKAHDAQGGGDMTVEGPHGLSSDEGHQEAAKKNRNMDGNVTKSTEEADDESDGPDYSHSGEDDKKGDVWGAEELKEAREMYDFLGRKVSVYMEHHLNDEIRAAWDQFSVLGDKLADLEKSYESEYEKMSHPEMEAPEGYDDDDDDDDDGNGERKEEIEAEIEELTNELEQISESILQQFVHNSLGEPRNVGAPYVTERKNGRFENTYPLPDEAREEGGHGEDEDNGVYENLEMDDETATGSKEYTDEEVDSEGTEEPPTKEAEDREELDYSHYGQKHHLAVNESLQVSDTVYIRNDFKRKWTVTKIDGDRLYVKSGKKKAVVNTIKEDVQLVEGKDLMVERNMSIVNNSKALWEEVENDIAKEERSILTESQHRTPEERQIIDKAVQDIHTDKLQVNDVLPEVPEDLRDDVLDELRRRGDDVYPERGPDGRGAGEEELEVKESSEIYSYIKERELHIGDRAVALQELASKFGNSIGEIENIFEDAATNTLEMDEMYSFSLADTGMDGMMESRNAWLDIESELDDDDNDNEGARFFNI